MANKDKNISSKSSTKDTKVLDPKKKQNSHKMAEHVDLAGSDMGQEVETPIIAQTPNIAQTVSNTSDTGDIQAIEKKELEMQVLLAKMKYMEDQITQITVQGYTSNVAKHLDKKGKPKAVCTISKPPSDFDDEGMSGDHKEDSPNSAGVEERGPYDSVDSEDHGHESSEYDTNKCRQLLSNNKSRKRSASGTGKGLKDFKIPKISRHHQMSSSDSDSTVTPENFLKNREKKENKAKNVEPNNDKDMFLKALEEEFQNPKNVGPQIDGQIGKIIQKMFTEPNDKQVTKLAEIYMPENIDVGTARVPNEIWPKLSYASQKGDVRFQKTDKGILNAVAILANLADKLTNDSRYEDAQGVFDALHVLGNTHVKLEQDRRELLKFNFDKSFRPMMSKNPRVDKPSEKMLFPEGINENVKLVLENDKLTSTLTHKPSYQNRGKEAGKFGGDKYSNKYTYPGPPKNYQSRPDQWQRNKYQNYNQKQQYRGHYNKNQYKHKYQPSSKDKKRGGKQNSD